MDGHIHALKALERLRRMRARQQVIEKRMVGGNFGLMVKDKLCISVAPGRLFVRVDPNVRLRLLKRSGAQPIKISGRVLTGFIFVDPPGYQTDPQLKTWLQHGLAAISLTPTRHRKGESAKQTHQGLCRQDPALHAPNLHHHPL